VCRLIDRISDRGGLVLEDGACHFGSYLNDTVVYNKVAESQSATLRPMLMVKVDVRIIIQAMADLVRWESSNNGLCALTPDDRHDIQAVRDTVSSLQERVVWGLSAEDFLLLSKTALQLDRPMEHLYCAYHPLRATHVEHEEVCQILDKFVYNGGFNIYDGFYDFDHYLADEAARVDDDTFGRAAAQRSGPFVLTSDLLLSS
jgi:hypothetical protein